jgi:hypothetical protein
MAPLVLRDLQDLPVLKVSKARLERLALREWLDQQVPRVFRGLLAHKET